MSTKVITIYDIAKELQIHPSTVSRGLQDDRAITEPTRKRITEVARTLGYHRNTLASSLRASKTNTIGVIISRVNSYFMSSAISGMESVASDHGYLLIISQSQENSKKEGTMIQTMFSKRVNGLLLSPAEDPVNLDQFRNKIFSNNVPVVFFDCCSHSGFNNVVIDNEKAGYDAAIHLLDQGCKRIVILGGYPDRAVYYHRLKGYQQALRERGIEYDPSYVIASDLDQQSGISAAAKILQMYPLPDGIFAYSDTVAVACLSELKKAGIKVPEEMAVVGFNNDPISWSLQANLSTIQYNGYQMGAVSMSKLIDIIQKRSAQRESTTTLPHVLIGRQSSKRFT